MRNRTCGTYKTYKKVILQTYYNLNGEYSTFPDNPLHNKTYTNVGVKITKDHRTTCGVGYEVDVVRIEGQRPIDCELVGQRIGADGTLVIGICQDWG